MDVPFAAGFLELLIHLCRTLLRRASDREFNRHRRHTQQHQKNQVQQDEGSAPVLSGQIRKLPHIADPDRAPGTQENKPQPAA